jgi:hypothetical protein
MAERSAMCVCDQREGRKKEGMEREILRERFMNIERSRKNKIKSTHGPEACP